LRLVEEAFPISSNEAKVLIAAEFERLGMTSSPNPPGRAAR
jgi:hypothetical protein